MKTYHRISILICIVGIVYVFAHIASSFFDLGGIFESSVNHSVVDTVKVDRVDLYIKNDRALENITQAERDVLSMIYTISNLSDNFFPEWFWNTTMEVLAKQLNAQRRKTATVLPYFTNKSKSENDPNWYKLHRNIRQYSLYDPDDPAIDGLLRDMSTQPIIQTRENAEGTQLKIDVKFQDGGWALLKAMRYSREGSVYNYGLHHYERHYAEIAAFHLDRILGWYRVPPTVGRRINIRTELEPLVSKEFRRTIFKNTDGKTCFYGVCRDSCKKRYAFCGDPEIIEVSLMHYLPTFPDTILIDVDNPWREKVGGKTTRKWVSSNHICNKTRNDFRSGNDLSTGYLDGVYFDLLIDNRDRHHFLQFMDFRNQTLPILVDHGRSFGNPFEDTQIRLFTKERKKCCLINKSTFLKFLKVYLGPDKLSTLMRASLKSDPVAPVLVDDLFTALDKRLGKIMHFLRECLQKLPLNDVILDDVVE